MGTLVCYHLESKSPSSCSGLSPEPGKQVAGSVLCKSQP